jgi:hypothetical protein
VDLLAGIPSVIYGLLGIYLLNPLMYRLERKIFAGSRTHQFTGGANLLCAVLVLAALCCGACGGGEPEENPVFDLARFAALRGE